MLRALRKASPYLRSYNYDTGDAEVDAKTHKAVEALLERSESCSATFDETSMFSGPEADNLREEFKHHFRNVSRIMDCVGCDKCRLWGKTQVTGLATGLKLLFSFDENATPANSASASNNFNLRRSEIVSFIWTLNRFSESLAAVEEFRQMWAKRNLASGKEQKAIAQQEDKAFNGDRAEEGQDGILGPVAIPAAEEEHEEDEPVEEDDGDAEVTPVASLSSRHIERTESNTSATFEQATTTSIGPLFHGLFERVLDACRSSLVACFALVERGLAFLAGTLAGEKSEL